MQAPRTTPGKRPAMKLLPEKSSDDDSDDPPGTAMPSRALGGCDDAAGSIEVDVMSSALAVLIEAEGCGDAVMVDADLLDGVDIDIETAHTPS